MLIGDSIAEQWPEEKFAPVPVGGILNLGCGGDTIENILWRLHDLPLHLLQARIAVIAMGTNNLRRGDDKDHIISGFEHVVAWLSNIWKATDIFVLPIHPQGDKDLKFRDEDRLKINEAVALLALSGQCSFVRLDEHQMSARDEIGRLKHYAVDFVHLNTSGYSELTTMLKNATTMKHKTLNSLDLESYQSVEVTEAGILDDLRKPLLDIAASVNRKIAINDDDLMALKAAHKSARKLIDEQFSNAVENFEARRRNVLAFDHVQVISLGFDCFARAVSTRWGLKKPRGLGEASHPFDTSIHPPSAVRHLLRTDFSDYMSNIEYAEDEDFPVRRDLGIKFNHETGTQWSLENFAPLKQTYGRRVDNFRTALTSSAPTAFVLHTHEADQTLTEDVRAIFNHLRGERRSLPTMFIWLFTPTTELARWGEQPYLGQDVRPIMEQYPFETYVWHRNKHAFSPRGFRFEKRVIRRISSAMSEFGWMDRDFVPVAYQKKHKGAAPNAAPKTEITVEPIVAKKNGSRFANSLIEKLTAIRTRRK